MFNSSPRRYITRIAAVADHCPPRAVGMLREIRQSATAWRLVAPSMMHNLMASLTKAARSSACWRWVSWPLVRSNMLRPLARAWERLLIFCNASSSPLAARASKDFNAALVRSLMNVRSCSASTATEQGQESWSELEDVLTAIRLAGLWEPHEIKYSGLVFAGLRTQEPSRLFVSIAIR